MKTNHLTAAQLAAGQKAADRIQATIHRLVATALSHRKPEDALGALATLIRRSVHSLDLMADPQEGISTLFWGARRDGLVDEVAYCLVRHAWQSATADVLDAPALLLAA